MILNYVKRGEARGTWLESHFRWQIRTFWFGLLWVCCASCSSSDAGHWHPDRLVALAIIALWFIYRIVRGWLALNDQRPMYA